MADPTGLPGACNLQQNTQRWTRDLDRIADAMVERLDLSLLADRLGTNLR